MERGRLILSIFMMQLQMHGPLLILVLQATV